MSPTQPAILEPVPGIWCVRDGTANAYLVKLLPGGVLVDTGPDPTGASVMLALQRARVGLRSLRALLLTHADCDASAGAARLSERSGAPVLVSAPQAAVLRNERPAPRPPGLRALFRRSTRVAAPGLALEAGADREPLRDGARIHEHFEVAATGGPGGDEGHLAFYFHPSGALFSGDAIETRGGRWRAAPGFDVHRLRERFPRVRALLPNHGEPCTDGVRERWAEMGDGA